jgi:hypothetical protein
MTRRATRDDLVIILGLLASGFAIGLIMSWAIVLLVTGLDYLGLHAHAPKGRLFREHPWQTGATIGSVLAVILAGSAVFDLAERIGWRGIVPSWMWPSTQQAETTVAIRLGRVLHWISVGIAAAALALAVAMWIEQSNRVPEAQQEHIAWEARHPIGPDGYRTGRNAFNTFDDDPEPYIPTVDYSISIAAVAFAALVALFGRGLRYVIASE